MMKTKYVGITEAYQESVCLFNAKLRGALPQYCDCTNTTAWGAFNRTWESHGVEEHSLDDYTEAVIADIDAITWADRELYRAAVDRFQREAREVEERLGTRILCRNLAEDPGLQYVLAPLAG